MVLTDWPQPAAGAPSPRPRQVGSNVRHHMAIPHENWSVRVSLGGALGFALALALLAALEATHQKADAMVAGDNERVVKVMLSVLLAAVMSIVSVVYAILPVSKGNWRPLIWLAVVALGWITLVAVMDFRSLLR
jgi:uncharacterized membrane protein